MKPGSKITGYVHPGSDVAGFPNVAPIYVNGYGQFILDGGEITGNQVLENGVISVPYSKQFTPEEIPPYTYKRGWIYDNVRVDNQASGNFMGYNGFETEDITHEPEEGITP
jgi:hypothetical protein